MAQLTIQQAFEQAIEHHRAGRLQQAEHLYRQVLALQPQHAGALNQLGAIATHVGRFDLAVDFLRRALAVRPDYADAHCNLGIAFNCQGRLDEAIAEYRQAISLKPDFAGAINNLGNALKYNRQLADAIAAYNQAIALNPALAEPHNNLGNALREGGQLTEAIASYHQAISLRPNYAEAHNNLGIALKRLGRFDESIAAYSKAIALKPNYAEPHNNLGNTLQDQGQLDQAIASYRQAIALKPNYAEAYNNLGNALQEKGQLDEGIAAFRQAIALRPDFAEAFTNLSNAMKDRGQLDESVAACRQAIALLPDFVEAHSNLIFTLHYHPEYDAQAIAQELDRWNRQHAQPLRKFIQPHTNDRSPDRPLRIGYVSPDFRNHPVGRNLLPWFHLHDRNQFDITCYAHVLRPDALTRQLQPIAGAWRDIVGLSDRQVADQIRQDRIDILVDLAVHTAFSRLLVFAHKPAPVQVSYLGYAGSTGMTSIDYRLSDPYLDPPGLDESCYSEKTIRLPQTYWCYQPGADPAVKVSPSPALKNGFITFGCQNNYCKISPPVWSAWTKILQAQPNSKLLVYTVPGNHRDSARNILASAGVDPSRLLFSDSRGADYFLTYNRIDIALDPFPFNGGTTTCDALWMGVPVVTLGGPTAVGRGGVSILSNIGLPELIASTPEQYVQIALDWAADLDRLNTLRQSLRARLAASPLMNAKQFVHDLESAYRRMWIAWCQNPAGHKSDG